jgi:hypothetical protein
VTTSARLVAALLGAGVAACAFLPWVGALAAWHLHLRTLISPGDNVGVGYLSSIGVLVTAAAGLVLLGALLNSRALVIVGGLGAVAVPTIWILANAVPPSDRAVPTSQIQIGAYGAAALGFMTLILAAVAGDHRVPTLR